MSRRIQASNRVAIVRFHGSDVVETWREALVLRDAGYRVQLICVGNAEEPRQETLDGVEIRRVRVDKRRGGAAAYVFQYVQWFVACFFILTAAAIRDPYRAIQVSTLPDHQVFAALVPKLQGTKIIVSFKEPAAEVFELLIGGTVSCVVALTTRAAIWFADECVAVTTAHRNNYVAAGAPIEKFSVVSNATPASWLGEGVAPRIDDAAVVAICHGTIEERWGYDTMIRAVALALPEVADLHLVLPGKGSYRETAEALATELGIADRVHFPGWVSTEELAGWLHRANLGFASQLPSSYSHLVHTGKMYDYFIAGIPVVASRLAAVEADFADSCAFYEPGSADDMAIQIVRVANDAAEQKRLVDAARTALATFGWQAQKATYLALFPKTARTGPGGTA